MNVTLTRQSASQVKWWLTQYDHHDDCSNIFGLVGTNSLIPTHLLIPQILGIVKKTCYRQYRIIIAPVTYTVLISPIEECLAFGRKVKEQKPEIIIREAP